MDVVNVHHAQSQLSRLLERVSKGEQIIIAKNGKPVAKLVPVTLESRRPGGLKGRIRMSSDFDEPLPAAAAMAAAYRGELD